MSILQERAARKLTHCLLERISRQIGVPVQHPAKQVCFWILAFRQMYRVTSGQITFKILNQFDYVCHGCFIPFLFTAVV